MVVLVARTAVGKVITEIVATLVSWTHAFVESVTHTGCVTRLIEDITILFAKEDCETGGGIVSLLFLLTFQEFLSCSKLCNLNRLI